MGSITTEQFQKLLSSLKERRDDVRLRIRFVGKMWHQDFYQVAYISTSGAVLKSDGKEFIYITSVNDVTEFEIDGPFHDLRPHVQYKVKPA